MQHPPGGRNAAGRFDRPVVINLFADQVVAIGRVGNGGVVLVAHEPGCYRLDAVVRVVPVVGEGGRAQPVGGPRIARLGQQAQYHPPRTDSDIQGRREHIRGLLAHPHRVVGGEVNRLAGNRVAELVGQSRGYYVDRPVALRAGLVIRRRLRKHQGGGHRRGSPATPPTRHRRRFRRFRPSPGWSCPPAVSDDPEARVIYRFRRAESPVLPLPDRGSV